MTPGQLLEEFILTPGQLLEEFILTPGQLLEEFIRSLLSDSRSAIRGVY